MTKTQAMKALQTAGTAQNRKIYGRHGVKDPSFGVSYANMGKLKKQIGIDRELSVALWKTGNHDARVLACMIGDSDAAGRAELNAAVRKINNYVLADAFTSYVGRGALRLDRALKWKNSRHEFTGQVGWGLIASVALHEGAEVDGAFFRHRLAEIEGGIDSAENRVRHSMNQALIAIGMRGPSLRKSAEAAARRIGVVEVDHGQTSCKTPAALPYLAKAWDHRNRKG